MGCEQATEAPASKNKVRFLLILNLQQSDRTTTAQTELKSGNMFYMVRDVADLQFKAAVMLNS